MPKTRAGGCLCGAVRYALTGPLHDAVYCHCRTCQRAVGAPVVAWATVTSEGFRYVGGEPGRYRSSPTATREFCARCGTALTFRPDGEPGAIDIALARLDAPEAAVPEAHIWTESRVQWFEIADALPRHPKGR